MQFNKKAILATAGILAGALAPASTVFAATGFDENGTSGSGLELPVYTAGSANTASGSAQARSVATVLIKTGFLSIDAVPDLHFDNSFAGGDALLKDNDRSSYSGADYMDGKDPSRAEGLLQVSDSRTTTTGGSSVGMNGWTLTLNLGSFSRNPQASDTGPVTVPASGWSLRMNQYRAAANTAAKGTTPFRARTGVSGTGGVAPTGISTATSNYKILSLNATAADATQTIWQAATGTGVGTTRGYYNTSDSAKLSIPKDASDGSYYAPLTWTLTAGVPPVGP